MSIRGDDENRIFQFLVIGDCCQGAWVDDDFAVVVVDPCERHLCKTPVNCQSIGMRQVTPLALRARARPLMSLGPFIMYLVRDCGL